MALDKYDQWVLDAFGVDPSQYETGKAVPGGRTPAAQAGGTGTPTPASNGHA